MQKYKLKIFSIIAGLITLTSCAHKKMDDTQEGKRIAEKSSRLITSDVDKNDTVHIGEKQYLVSGVSLSSGNSAYTWDYNNNIKTDEYKKDNMYFSNIKYTNITTDEAKKILTEFYNGKSVADICKNFSKNIKI
jgi:lipoprotein